MTTKVFKNGATVTLDRNKVTGFYTVLLRTPAGEVRDKVSVDNRPAATDYHRSFSKIARAMK